MPNRCESSCCRVGLLDSFYFCQKKAVSRILVTDAKGFLKRFHFGMEKMAFSFGVALELVRTRKKRHVRINLQGQPFLQQTHQPLECYIIFWKRPAKMSKTMPCPSRCNVPLHLVTLPGNRTHGVFRGSFPMSRGPLIRFITTSIMFLFHCLHCH